MKICPVVAQLFHVDGHNEANSCFSKFCEHTYKTVHVNNCPTRCDFTQFIIFP